MKVLFYRLAKKDSATSAIFLQGQTANNHDLANILNQVRLLQTGGEEAMTVPLIPSWPSTRAYRAGPFAKAVLRRKGSSLVQPAAFALR